MMKSKTLKITLNKKSILCLSGQNKKGANRTMKVKRPLQRQMNMFGE